MKRIKYIFHSEEFNSNFITNYTKFANVKILLGES